MSLGSDPNTRICSTCRIEKPLDEFYLSKRTHGHLRKEGHRQQNCKLCSQKSVKRYLRAHPGIRKEMMFRRHLKKKYGVTFEEYQLILMKQDGVCAICEGKPGKTKLSLDHDHDTKKIRGLLCVPCNISLRVIENENLLRKALAYLERFK